LIPKCSIEAVKLAMKDAPPRGAASGAAPGAILAIHTAATFSGGTRMFTALSLRGFSIETAGFTAWQPLQETARRVLRSTGEY